VVWSPASRDRVAAIWRASWSLSSDKWRRSARGRLRRVRASQSAASVAPWAAVGHWSCSYHRDKRSAVSAKISAAREPRLSAGGGVAAGGIMRPWPWLMAARSRAAAGVAEAVAGRPAAVRTAPLVLVVALGLGHQQVLAALLCEL